MAHSVFNRQEPFPIAHIEKALGSARENRDYILKAGKWANTDKAGAFIEGSFMEWGKLPAEKEEKAPQMRRLLESLRDGKTTTLIIHETPGFAFRVREFEACGILWHEVEALARVLLPEIQ